eukprot:sb/3476578/
MIGMYSLKSELGLDNEDTVSCYVQAARLWNTLPKEVTTAATLDTFKVLLGRWLDHFPDNPPVKVYLSSLSSFIKFFVDLDEIFRNLQGHFLIGVEMKELRQCAKRVARDFWRQMI